MNLTSIIPVLAVDSLEQVHDFYKALFGETDIEPEAGIAEWEVAEGHYLQVVEIPERAGSGAVVVGCTDVAAFVARARERGVEMDDPQEFDYFTVAVVRDPAGNELQFAQDTAD